MSRETRLAPTVKPPIARIAEYAYIPAMPKTTRTDELLAFFIDRLAEAVVARMGGPRATSSTGPGTRKRRARQVDMRCRFPNCKTRSKGPRFRFLCEEHLKLPKRKQNAVIAEAAAAH
jgi:hypothetical protein